jgi:PEP-CTERM motif
MNFKSLSLNGIAAASLLACLSISNAATVILNFDRNNACGVNTPCSNYTSIAETYGTTAELSVNFVRSSLNLPAYWDRGYGNLQGVAFQNNANGTTSGPISSDPLIINFTAAAGYLITDFSFDYATYQFSDGGPFPPTFVSISTNAAGYNGSVYVTSRLMPTALGTFAPGFVPNGTSGLTLAFGPDNWQMGIDNITIQVSAVPEPGEWAMMLAGLGVVGAIARRRRSKISA